MSPCLYLATATAVLKGKTSVWCLGAGTAVGSHSRSESSLKPDFLSIIYVKTAVVSRVGWRSVAPRGCGGPVAWLRLQC